IARRPDLHCPPRTASTFGVASRGVLTTEDKPSGASDEEASGEEASGDAASGVHTLRPAVLGPRRPEKVSTKLEVPGGPLKGRTLGDFLLHDRVGAGGFGDVYLAEQTALGREAIVKVLRREGVVDGPRVQRFLREAQLASRLDHPYAAHIYAFGAEPDGVLWIAMELVRGTPLDQLLEVQGPLPLERFVPLLERICEVVETAHEQGIVHCDLKPANVMVLA